MGRFNTIKKGAIVLIGIVLLIMLSHLSTWAFEGAYETDVATILRTVSVVTCITFAVECVLWYCLTKELFTPFMVFFIILFFFTCGQAFGWAFNLDMGSKDMWNRVDHGMDKALLIKGVCYSAQCLCAFWLGSVISFSTKKREEQKGKYSYEGVRQAFMSRGKVLLFLCVPAFLVKMSSSLITVYFGGYSALYTAESNPILNIISYYYQPCLLLLLIAYKEQKTYRRIIVGAMLLDVVLYLYVGSRASAVVIVFGILLSYHYFVKPFTKKDIIWMAILGSIGVTVLNAIAATRGQTGRSIVDFADYGSTDSMFNQFGTMTGELGWTICALCWTIELVPSSYGFRMGKSYLVSLISWIPNAFFGGSANHPAAKWGYLADWLQKTLNMSYGPGYTMFAESYINYGQMGYLAVLVEGFVIGKLVAGVRRKDAQNDLLKSTIQVMIVMTIMKSLIRSSMSIATRMVVFVLLPLFVLVISKLKREESK